jgi:thiamine transport system permease protein
MNLPTIFGQANRWQLWLAPLFFLGLFFFHPLARILWIGLASGDVDRSFFEIAQSTLTFTLWQAFVSTLLTLLFGIPSAFLFARFQFPAKRLLRALTALPFMLPTVVVAAGFNALLGPRGWINLIAMSIFQLDAPPIEFLNTFTAILTAHVFYNMTIVIRLAGNALSQIDPRYSQAAQTLGAPPLRVLRQIIFPLLQPALIASALLVFLFDFTSFGVILLLGGSRFSTLEVEIYIQAFHNLNLQTAALLSIIQLICTLIFSTLYSRVILRNVNPSNKTVEPVAKPPRGIEKIFAASMSIALALFYVLPLAALPLRSVARLEANRADRSEIQPGITFDYYRELFVNRRDSIFYVPPFRAAINSLGYALVTVILSLAMGFPAAYALARPGSFERWIDPLLLLPLGASSITLGLGYLIAFSVKPINWLASPIIIPLAHTTIALPFVIRALQPALASIPQRYREAASVLGAPPQNVRREIDLPIIARAVLSAAGFAFTVSLGEFGAASLLARPDYPTLPTAIARFLSQPGALNYGQAMAMATLLMLICLAGILIIEHERIPSSGEL